MCLFRYEFPLPAILTYEYNNNERTLTCEFFYNAMKMYNSQRYNRLHFESLQVKQHASFRQSEQLVKLESSVLVLRKVTACTWRQCHNVLRLCTYPIFDT